MSLAGAVTANGSGTVEIRPYTTGVSINLGATADPVGGPLGLSDAEMRNIDAGALEIGDGDAGTITVSAPVTMTASKVPNVNLITAGSIVFDEGSLTNGGANITLTAGSGSIQPNTVGTDVNVYPGSLGFGTPSGLAIAINGTTPDSGYRQLNIMGNLNLSGVSLTLSGSLVPAPGSSFAIINNAGHDPIIGTFNGLPEGAVIANFLGSGLNATISYVGGNGNDVVITVPSTVSAVSTTTIVNASAIGSAVGTVQYGVPLTLWATVTPSSGNVAPTLGSVYFRDAGNIDLGVVYAATVSGADAIYTLVTAGVLEASAAAHTITATYSPAVGFASSVATLAGGMLVTPAPLTVVAPPGWLSVAAMANSRADATATLLPNGKVLVAGGYENGFELAAAALYDPPTNIWSSAGSMASARAFHTATLLPNGQVLVTGGVTDGQGTLASAELYNPATNSWSSAGSMSYSRHYQTATLLPNGQVLVAGGEYNQYSGLASAELYNPLTNTWSLAASMTTGREGQTATLLPNGQVLVTGGVGSNLYNVLPSTELYNPATNIWSKAASMADGREGHTATLLPTGEVLVAGGETFDGTAEVYNYENNSWISAGSMSASRKNHTATLLQNGQVLVVGGYGASQYGDGDQPGTELYDPATNTWTSAGVMATRREGQTATLLPDGQVLIAGGQDDYEPLYSVEIFNASSFDLANNKVYDGTTSASLNLAGLSLAGVYSGDTIILSIASVQGMFASKNVGNNTQVTSSGFAAIGRHSSSYTVIQPTGKANITQAALTITAASNTKMYDSTTRALATPTVSGLQGTDKVTGLAETYGQINTGTGLTLSVTAYVINDGNGGNNYSVATVASATGLISPAPLTITPTTNTKTYDSTTSAAAIPTVSGLYGNDAVISLAEVYASANAGLSRALSIAAYAINDGNGGNNYVVTTVTNNLGLTNPAALTITALTNTKVFDNSTIAAATPTVSGLLGVDTVTGLSESYADASVGTGKTLFVNPGYVVLDGNNGNNYVVTTVSNATGATVPVSGAISTTTTITTTVAGVPVSMVTYGTLVTLIATVSPSSGGLAPSGAFVDFVDASANVDLGATTAETVSGTSAFFTLVTTANALQVIQANGGIHNVMAIYAPAPASAAAPGR